PQLMKFKTAMDVRIGLPNEHLSGSAKNEINQPMYATAVGLIMRGFDYLDTYHKQFNAGVPEEYEKPKAAVKPQPVAEKPEEEEEEVQEAPRSEGKVSISDQIKSYLSKIFEVEDQPI
ncbi:MAG TPA: hypothetical protein VHO68_08805, partial [Bacteroidales bacterium]|nr:hypothetical protein [Bacteroidales bacterium]